MLLRLPEVNGVREHRPHRNFDCPEAGLKKNRSLIMEALTNGLQDFEDLRWIIGVIFATPQSHA